MQRCDSFLCSSGSTFLSSGFATRTTSAAALSIIAAAFRHRPKSLTNMKEHKWQLLLIYKRGCWKLIAFSFFGSSITRMILMYIHTPTGLGLERDLDPLLRFDSDKPSFRRGEQSDQGPYHSKRLLPIINIRERVYHSRGRVVFFCIWEESWRPFFPFRYIEEVRMMPAFVRQQQKGK